MLIPFIAWHLEMLPLAENVKAILGKYPASDIVTKLAANGLAFTIVAEDGRDARILGVVGAVPIKDGKTAEVFVVAAKNREAHSLVFAKTVKRILQTARLRFATIEAVSMEGTKDRWFEWLGFRPLKEPGRWRLAN